MKTAHCLILVSCAYMVVGLANLYLKFTHIEIIQMIWLAFLIVPLNNWLARKLGLSD